VDSKKQEEKEEGRGGTSKIRKKVELENEV
jgi:hypothetical protein